MSRFGSTGHFYWDSGDTLLPGNSLLLDVQDMFQFPFETSQVTDAVSYRSINGRRYEYENYRKDMFTFNWVDLREITRNRLFEMVTSLPILSFSSPPSDSWGTFRVVPDSWSDSESSHERYNVSFTIEGH